MPTRASELVVAGVTVALLKASCLVNKAEQAICTCLSLMVAARLPCNDAIKNLYKWTDAGSRN